MTENATLPANVADLEEAMRDVVDPELGINVVDLGLVYGITVDPQNHAIIDMTLQLDDTVQLADEAIQHFQEI